MVRGAYYLRDIKEGDLSQLLEIYNYYIVNTTATFHSKPLSINEMKELVMFDDPKYKTYVIEQDDWIIGYAILSQHKKRQAYDRTGEVTVYLKNDFTNKGIGTVAVKYIEAEARKNGFHTLVATICGENNSSIQLFERNGYAKCAHYKEVGFKFDQLLDVVAYQKII
jgi:L-amino acid N-acyltransferase YncA